MGEWVGGWVGGWVGRWVSGWMGGQEGGWTGGWTSEWIVNSEGTGLEDRGDEFRFRSIEFGAPLDKWMGTTSKRWENIQT